MAVTYVVERKQDDSFTESKAMQGDIAKLSNSASMNYVVEVSDPADQSFDPRNINSSMVKSAAAQLPGAVVKLPLVNRTVWNFDGLTIAYLVCSSVNVTRDPDRRSRFNVNTQWTTGTPGDLNSVGKAPPSTLDGYPPEYEYELLGEDHQLWTDLNSKTYRSPSGSVYSEPLLERVPIQQFTISQYEPSITYSEMKDRLYQVNSTTWQTVEPYTYMITDISASDVVVPLSGGDVNAAKVVMQVTERWPTWHTYRWNVDTHYIDNTFIGPLPEGTPYMRRPFKDLDGETFANGIVATDGTAAADQEGEPGSERFDNFRERDFNTFIQDIA